MGNCEENPEGTSVDLQEEVEKRKMWFFECQLRRLNLESFQHVVEDDPRTESLLNLISESCVEKNPPLGCSPTITRVYRDSEKPVWTKEEKERRDKFKDITTGKRGSWLDYNVPNKLAEKLAEQKELYEKSEFGSQMFDAALNKFGRKDPFIDRTGQYPPKENDKLEHAICKVEITEKKPWLIPEIFNRRNFDTSDVLKWIENGETFIANFERELNELFIGKRGFHEQVTPENYRRWVAGILKDTLTMNGPLPVTVQFIDQSSKTWEFNIKLQTHAHQNVSALQDYYSPSLTSDSVIYWINSCNNKLKEIYVHKSESDMGLCLIMRTLYLYGTLPSSFNVSWRNRKFSKNDTPEEVKKFHDFFQEKAKLAGDNKDLQDRLTKVKTKLQVILEETAVSQHSGSIHFSPLAQEIVKQAVLGYKFWLDEPFHVYDYYDDDQEYMKAEGLNKAKMDNGLGGEPSDDYEKLFSEMEFWSENHYIMFASSEYLAGQLWPDESFQPARDFLRQEDKDKKFGVFSGKQRMERGKARVLKWLNNRLLFGWTEFNSSGYYREHLFALLNLADFGQDDEVRQKAVIATDLLLFDITRFSHKGSMGAAGGRSQFASKNCGWDNAPGDLVEIMLGTRGIFIDRDGEIGCYFATSAYQTPAVLLEIGSNPPKCPFVDRSRVSITFEEAPKYGIQLSQVLDQRTSIEAGFAPKREKHFRALDSVNKAIVASHPGYEGWMDDTVFWWTMSGYFSKEVVRNTLRLIKAFKLQKTGVFKEMAFSVDGLIPFLERVFHGVRGTSIFGLSGAPASILGLTPGAGAAKIAGGLAGFLLLDDAVFDVRLIEEGSEDFATFLDGSTRTRANILTYCNGDVMLSSLQNFRPGQLNFQTNVNHATFNTSLNIFTTGAFAGIDLSSFETGFLGGALLGSTALGVIGAGVGVVGGILLNEGLVEGEEALADHSDGPGWWTGYWALPMVVQHESAAIIAYDFNTLQEKLAKVGSHVWFPTAGFDDFAKRESSAYVDENIVINDLFGIPQSAGQGGKWLFGKKIHKENPLNPDDNEEGYIAVFSNEDPECLDKDDEFYKAQIEKAKGKVEDFSSNDIFANKDWYVDKKNIWIIQVGNKKEFGSFEHFIDRVSRARIEIDDVGDMECTYHMPKPDGGTKVFSLNYGDDGKITNNPGSQALSLKYGDGGKFTLDGVPFQNDFYPRFENCFIRGGRVEWGQREYVIEYRGKSLIHDFSNLELPERYEEDKPAPGDSFTVKGLVIYLKNEDQEMEIFTVASAKVKIDCSTVAEDEVVAVGMVKENNYHDAEWIFFDHSALSQPDMTIDIGHHVIPGKDADTDNEWKFTFTLKALMGDRSLKQCTVRPIPLGTFYLRDDHRNTGPVPFSVQLFRWRNWNVHPAAINNQVIAGMVAGQPGTNTELKSWMIAGQPGYDYFYFDYIDILSFDQNNILQHQQHARSCVPFTITSLTGGSNEPKLGAHFSLFPYSTRPGYLFLFLISEGILYTRGLFSGGSWSAHNWEKMSISYQPMLKIPFLGIEVPDPDAPPVPVPLGILSRVQATFINYGEVTPAVYISGEDGNFYTTSKWPLDKPYCWRQIETASAFKLLPEIPFQVGGNSIVAMDLKRSLWRYSITPGKEDESGYWEQVPLPDFSILGFTIAPFDDKLQVITITGTGEVWSIRLSPGAGYNEWIRIGVNFRTYPGAQLSCTSAVKGRLDIFAPAGTDTGDKLHTSWWMEETGWKGGDNWVAIDPDAPVFKVSPKGDIKAISRVNGQIEIFATDINQNIWKNWWS